MTIGQILKKARESKGFTLRQVESKADVSNAYLSQLENGKITSPSVKVVSRLCNLYEISIDEMFNGRDEQPSTSWTDLNVYLTMLSIEEVAELTKFADFLLWKRNQPQPNA